MLSEGSCREIYIDNSIQNQTAPEQSNRLGVNVPVFLVQSHLKVGETESDQEVLSSELRAQFCPRTVVQREKLIQVAGSPNISKAARLESVLSYQDIELFSQQSKKERKQKKIASCRSKIHISMISVDNIYMF